MKRTTRVYVDAALQAGTSYELPADTGAHLAKVLRARSGDEVILFTGDGREFDAAIESVRGSRVAVSIGSVTAVDLESPFAVTLVQSIPRGDRMDFVVQKATELGVARIVPVLSRHSVVRLSDGQAESKRAHWAGVAVSACEQCGRTRVPEVELPCALLDYASRKGQEEVRWVMEPDSAALAQALLSVTAAPASAAVLIGPEGGFAPEELDALALAGFARLGLGPRILRTETAALAALTFLQTLFGDLAPGRSWTR